MLVPWYHMLRYIYRICCCTFLTGEGCNTLDKSSDSAALCTFASLTTNGSISIVTTISTISIQILRNSSYSYLNLQFWISKCQWGMSRNSELLFTSNCRWLSINLEQKESESEKYYQPSVWNRTKYVYKESEIKMKSLVQHQLGFSLSLSLTDILCPKQIPQRKGSLRQLRHHGKSQCWREHCELFLFASQTQRQSGILSILRHIAEKLNTNIDFFHRNRNRNWKW